MQTLEQSAIKAEETKLTIEENIDLLAMFFNYIKSILPNIIIALLIFIFGYFLAKYLRKKLKTFMIKAGTDITLVGFFSQVIFMAVIIIVAVVALGILGVPTSSFVAAIGGLGIAIGLALQSNLSNFASGIIILIFKPFKVGDYIETKDGVKGTVNMITTMNTSLNTNDNKRIYIPNLLLTSNHVINYSQNPTRNLILNIKISHDADYIKAMDLIRNILINSEYTEKNTDVICEISELSSFYVNIFTKSVVKTENYWTIHYNTMKEIKEAFIKNKIEFANLNFIAKA